MIYTIKAGDTLFKIAQTHNTTIEELVKLNGLTRPNDLAIGQNIFIPMGTANNNPTTYQVVAGDTMYKIANKFNVPLSALISANPQISNPNIINIGDEKWKN